MIRTAPLDSIKPGNPFLSDYSHMGSQLGTNCVVMYPTHGDQKMDYLIIVNTETGERLKVDLSDDDRSFVVSKLFDGLMKQAREETL